MKRMLLLAVILPLPMAGLARAGEAPPSPTPEASPSPGPQPALISGNRVFFGGGVSDQPFVLSGIALNGGAIFALGFGATYDNLAAPHRFSVEGVFSAFYSIKNIQYFAMGPEVFFFANLNANPANVFTIRTGYAFYYSSAALPFVLGFGLDVDFIFTRDHFQLSVLTPGLRFAFGI